MSDLVISAEGLRKTYRLGVFGSGTLAGDINAWWARLRGAPDPRVPIGREEDARRAGEVFEALRGVSFQVQRGEILGIIGRNGAGKSTLLKLLSRITLPTEGTVGIKGRVGSLLEVGTGFNPELTGRENIYLNGAILGMKKAEIDRKLDAIITFSGIEHHMDTPVKRYSSGMKVRLGFAVAAHLEPEILIIDEVLAVGDAEFQRKCMGKMKDVAQGGRTILFVSHNMVAVRSLCTRVIWLDEGRVRMDGPVQEVAQAYLSMGAGTVEEISWSADDAPGSREMRLRYMHVERESDGGLITCSDPFRIVIGFDNLAVDDGDLNVAINVRNDEEMVVFGSGWREHEDRRGPIARGAHVLRCQIPGDLLNSGSYHVAVNVYRDGRTLLRREDAISFTIHDTERRGSFFGRRLGVFRPRLAWTAEQVRTE